MFENWPDLVAPQRVKKDCHFSNQTVYALVKIPGLGVQIGKRLYFLKKNFIQWLEQESLKEKTH
jgi:hypothetical protein